MFRHFNHGKISIISQHDFPPHVQLAFLSVIRGKHQSNYVEKQISVGIIKQHKYIQLYTIRCTAT